MPARLRFIQPTECIEVDKTPEGDFCGASSGRTHGGHLRHSKFLRLRDPADMHAKG
jgi:hypothetical protein